MITDIKYLQTRISIFIIFAIVFLSIPVLSQDTSVVDRYGTLSVAGNKIVDRNGRPVILRGMSLFWSQWSEGSKYYNYDCVKWLRDDWNCTVVRAAMGIEGGGYLTNPAFEKAKVKTVIDACIDLGIYVIIDWHDHYAQRHRSSAISFFEEIAAEYGDQPNIIYEIYNEPVGSISWADSVKPYADSVVQHIRAIDPDNLILVGSPNWSQDVDVAAINPLLYSNIAYTLHFYAANHKQLYRNKAIAALNKNVALFVSEFGTCETNGSGVFDSLETVTWMNFMNTNSISWCNWSISDKNETASALVSGANAAGGWPTSDLTRSGYFIRDRIKEENAPKLNGVTTNSGIPVKFKLSQNYPNPFNPATTIRYELPVKSFVSMKIFDLLGREITTLVNEIKPEGIYNIKFNGSALPSGIYICRLQAGNSAAVGKLILVK